MQNLSFAVGAELCYTICVRVYAFVITLSKEARKLCHIVPENVVPASERARFWL